MISQISIKNFRSLSNVTLTSDSITTFVGSNDAGKSNVLRALNLFFNGETNPQEAFDFSRDYNQFAALRKGKAPQVEITITFDLPSGYIKNGQPTKVEWKKVWRREGEVRSLEKRKFGKTDQFPSRSKIPALLDRIEFTYVPAIKDKAFFADLQGRLYDVLSSVAEKPLKDSAGAFQDQLGDQLQELLNKLNDSFGSEASMRLPENLREIFESLEINSEDIPLSRRGDGIKIRHIPMMLNFIADKRDSLLARGGVRYTHIWGFEEPENNVEMAAAFSMVDDFVDIVANSDKHQLFITTHSPIFYRLDQHRPEASESVISHFVSKQKTDSKIETRKPDEVDETMGLMPLVAPYVKDAKDRYTEIQDELKRIQEVAAQRRPTVFVEGDTDKTIITKAWIAFSNISIDHANICSGDCYGSANALSNRSLAWMLNLKHKPVSERVKAAAIFDDDESGNNARAALGKEIERMKLSSLGFKRIKLPKPERLISLIKDGFILDADLEALYSDELWDKADEMGWLEDIEHFSSRLTKARLDKHLKGGPNPFETLGAEDSKRVKKRFNDKGKSAAVKHIQELDSAKARSVLKHFEPIIRDLEKHLFPNLNE